MLEAVGHVTMENFDVHWLLGEIAVGIRDESLLDEARAFLRHFNAAPQLRKLYQVEASGVPDFIPGSW
jgi:hypothetical protein